MEGMTVRRDYQNYSTELEGHVEVQTTDPQGHALFPERWASASTFSRVRCALLSARAGVHASFGPHAHVHAFGKGMEGDAVSGQYLTDWNGSPEHMRSLIKVRLSSDPRSAR